MMKELSDEILQQRAVDGKDYAALSALCTRHWKGIYNLCLRALNNSADAEEVTQEIFVKLLKALPKFRRENFLKPWWYRIASNHLNNFIRGRYSTQKAMRQVARRMTQEEASMGKDEELMRSLEESIAGLPEEQRSPVLLYYYQDFSQSEIAGILECSQKTVSTRLEKALNALRRMMPGTGSTTVASLLGGVVLMDMPASLQTVGQKILLAYAATAGLNTAAVSSASLITVGGIMVSTKTLVFCAILAFASLFIGYMVGNVAHSQPFEVMDAVDSPVQIQVRESQKYKALLGNLEERTEMLAAGEKQAGQVQAALAATQAELEEVTGNLDSARAELAGAKAGPEEGVPGRSPLETKYFGICKKLVNQFKELSEEEKAALSKKALGREFDRYIDNNFEQMVGPHILLNEHREELMPAVYERLATEEDYLMLISMTGSLQNFIDTENKVLSDNNMAKLLETIEKEMAPENSESLFWVLNSAVRVIYRHAENDEAGRNRFSVEQKQTLEAVKRILLAYLAAPFQRELAEPVQAVLYLTFQFPEDDYELKDALVNFLLRLPAPTEEDLKARPRSFMSTYIPGNTTLGHVYRTAFRAMQNFADEHTVAFLQENFLGKYNRVFDLDILTSIRNIQRKLKKENK
ncbi:RNA polymerase sigma factor [Planctomycetota bacterium]